MFWYVDQSVKRELYFKSTCSQWPMLVVITTMETTVILSPIVPPTGTFPTVASKNDACSVSVAPCCSISDSVFFGITLIFHFLVFFKFTGHERGGRRGGRRVVAGVGRGSRHARQRITCRPTAPFDPTWKFCRVSGVCQIILFPPGSRDNCCC